MSIESNLGKTTNFVTHDPLTCPICHAEGTSAEVAALHAELERLREAVEELLVIAEARQSLTRRIAEHFNRPDLADDEVVTAVIERVRALTKW